MDKLTLTIEKVQNGFILTGEGTENNGPFVIQEDDRDELEALTWQVWEYFGYHGSKHDPARLMIVRQRQK